MASDKVRQRSKARQQRHDAMDRAKGVIRRAVEADWPRNWTDPLLTGPERALLGEVNCPQIERLLDGLKSRVLNVIDSTVMR